MGKIPVGKIAAVGTAAAVGGLIGAGSGDYIGGTLFGNSPGSNNLTGSTTGRLALGGAGALVAGGVTALAANPNVTKKLVTGTLEGIGAISIGAMETVGAASIGLAKGAGIFSAIAIPSTIKAAGEIYGKPAANIMSKFVRPASAIDKHVNELMPYKLTKLGTAALIGTGLVSSFKEGFDDFNRNRMGQMDNRIYRATPTIPSYANNGGATGDLVFALNKNRRG